MKYLAKPFAGVLLAVLLTACSERPAGEPATSESTEAAATVETAEEFVARVNDEYKDWWRELNAADWLRATYINEDSAIVAAKASERYAAWHATTVKQALKYDGQELSDDTRRALDLLKFSAIMVAPDDDAKRKELAQIMTELEGMYGAGEYCRSEGDCLSGNELELKMQQSRDYDELLDLWQAIAARYRARSIVAGYDLINEPEPPKGQDLVDLYRRIIKAIRAVDPHHLVFLGGTALSTDFSFYQGPIDDNQAYTFHTYDFFSHDVDASHVAGLAKLAEEHDVPLWNGEFGAHTDRWTSAQIALFEDPDNHVNGWIYWPWKRVSENDWRRKRFGHLMEIDSTEAWDTVRKHLGSIFGLKKIPKELARQALADFLEASKAENLIADEKMVAALQSWKSSDAHP